MDKFKYPGARAYTDGSVPGAFDQPALQEVDRCMTELAHLDLGRQAEIDNPGVTRKVAGEFLDRARKARDELAVALEAAEKAIASAESHFRHTPEPSKPQPRPIKGK